ncbi:hypothetical protein CPB84DRAFT_655335 [Gymnopilus junonius]|uniref:Brain protein I3 n=1 Tax=Gymnopilus junonius TaxID=109634 RepID=A0A9P5NU89_GYMJU|nr:hypothetical protein CPB84DRAFT_655335 [Gymnopilus junonius]
MAETWQQPPPAYGSPGTEGERRPAAKEMTTNANVTSDNHPKGVANVYQGGQPAQVPSQGEAPMNRSQHHTYQVYQPPMDAGERFRAEMFARCARGEHQVTTKYGPCGIITAIFCFPVGLLCLFADREKSCTRCGQRL